MMASWLGAYPAVISPNDEMSPLNFPDMEIDITPIAAVLSDRARVAMLWAVSDGRRLPAAALAAVGHVTPSAASAHLAKLVDTGLLGVERDGRHRRYWLANPAIVAALEALAAVPPAAPPEVPVPSPLSLARTCYDHLAGALGVRITDVLIARGALGLEGDVYRVTGAETFSELGLDLDVVKESAHDRVSTGANGDTTSRARWAPRWRRISSTRVGYHVTRRAARSP
jgi:DNA-binding transcriptional ArsR family regulator